MRIHPFCLVALVGLALSGCGGDDSEPASQTPQNDAGGDQGVVQPKNTGIMAIMSPSALDAKNYWGWGAFSTNETPGTCTVSAIGTCQHRACVETQNADLKLVKAGNMTAKVGDKTFNIVPKDMTGIYAFDGTGLLWSGGEKIEVSTLGDVGPAVSASVLAPKPVVFTAPAFPPTVPVGTKMTLDSTKELEITWQSTAAAMVVAEFAWYDDPSGKSDTIVCEFPGPAAQAKVAAEVLATMKGLDHLTLVMKTQSTAVQTVGDWQFELQAISYGTTAAEDLALATLDMK